MATLLKAKTKTVNGAKIILNVYETTDYNLFKILEGNRAVVPLHVERLKKSFQEDYLINPIIVNEKHEIIDGQNRFTAAKELNLPIRFIIIERYGLDEIHRLNSLGKNWTSDDFLNSYVGLNYPEYIKLKAFKEKYKLGYKAIFSLVGIDHGRGSTEVFRSGLFVFKKHARAVKIAEYINKILEYYDGAKRRSFVAAINNIFDKKDFDKDSFIKKLSYQSAKMVDCTNTTNYLILIEEIYNYKRSNKINLRF